MAKKNSHLTDDQIEETRKSLEEKLKRKVYAFAFVVEGDEQVVAYLRDPERLLKMRAMDMIMQSLTGSCEMLLKACIIEPESSSRIMSGLPEDDQIFMSALLEVQRVFKFYTDVLKKN